MSNAGTNRKKQTGAEVEFGRIMAAFVVPHPPLIIPDVGRGSEEQVADTIAAYRQVARRIVALHPDTIIITSPHATMYADYFHISPGESARGSFAQFGAGQVSFDEEYDSELCLQLCGECEAADIAAGTLGEIEPALDHGTMVPLYFIRQEEARLAGDSLSGDDSGHPRSKILRIGLSGLPLTEHYKLGVKIRRAVEAVGRRAVFVASGDLSHKLQDYGPYGFAPEGPVYDERVMDVLGRAAFGELLEFDETLCEKAAECGHRSFVIMAGAFDGYAVDAEVFVHQDVTGVGYGIAAFTPGEKDESRHFLDQYMRKMEERTAAARRDEDPYVALARRSVESYILHRKKLKIEGEAETAGQIKMPAELTDTQAGAFVSIHEFGKLRGCIGTILPYCDCLAQEIIDNAVSASTRDPRFAPITADELPYLEINVDVLTEPERIDSPDELDVKRYGVIVTCGAKRGLLLPDLDGVDTVEQQISIAMQKGGILPGEDYVLDRFEVVRHT